MSQREPRLAVATASDSPGLAAKGADGIEGDRARTRRSPLGRLTGIPAGRGRGVARVRASPLRGSPCDDRAPRVRPRADATRDAELEQALSLALERTGTRSPRGA